MKNPITWVGCFFLLMGILIGWIPAKANDEFQKIDAELVDRAVVLQVPEGVRRIRIRIKAEDGVWETCTLAHLSGTGGYLKLRLPDGVNEADLEVAASWSDPFPFEFYQGTSKFEPSTSDNDASRLAPGGAEFVDTTTVQESGDTVVESDIWKWRDNILYFFNQFRGLQVIDASDPAAPKRLASLRVPVGGEQLYLHPEEDVAVLLTYDGSSGNGRVLPVEHTDENTLVPGPAIPLPGYILESRMVGTMLYVVSRLWWEESLVDSDSGVQHINWKSGLAVSKIDLADPSNPVVSEPLKLQSDRYNYWGGQVQATSEALLIATNEYDHNLRQSISTVHVVDISDPAKGPSLAFQIPVAGQVLNKFNLQLKEDVLTVVSQVWRWSENRNRYASVETFDLSQPSQEPLTPLASLQFANNETITATRFAGDLLYVVTVLVIDPLFVISLADPANPKLLGELEVPGFSTHLEVLGDSLISVGVEDSQIAVSWFDVSNLTEPGLFSRVYVGDENGWSWSEANWDEKAFGFFPEDGWILLPYQGYDGEHGWTSGVQLIEMGDNTLIKRGSIRHDFQARRARVLGDAVVSISGQSLKSLNISDPDNPVLLAELTLAWPVDYLHRVGDYLIQLERGPSYWWGGVSPATGKLYVSPVADTDELITSLELPGGRVAGTWLQDPYLIVAQESFVEADQENEGAGSFVRFSNTVVDVSNPLAPEILGTDFMDSNNEGWYGFGSDYLGAVLPGGALLWYPAEFNYNFFAEPGRGLGLTDAFFPYYPSAGKIFTVSTDNKTQPRILASRPLVDTVALEKDGVNYWAEGGLKLDGSVLYFGLQNNKYEEQEPGVSRWFSRHWLGQMNLENPASPKNAVPVEIPGVFENMLTTESGGRVLFTSIQNFAFTGESWNNQVLIQGSAFDGLQAFLLDEIDLGDQGYGPRVFSDKYLVTGYTDHASTPTVTELTTYEWLDGGSFLKHQTMLQAGAIYRLGVVDGLLFASGSGTLSVFDFADPTDPERTVVAFPGVDFWQRTSLIDVYAREIAYLPQGWQGVNVLDFDGAFQSNGVSLKFSVYQADSTEDWIAIDVSTLSSTKAGNNLVLGSLSPEEDWVFANAVEQIAYVDWMRGVLNLGDQEEPPSHEIDSDGDGLSNAWEYFTGTHPGDRSEGIPMESWCATDLEGNRHLHLRLPYNIHAAESIIAIPQFSYDLSNWADFPEGFEEISEDYSPAKIFRMLEPVDTLENLFIQLRLQEM